MKIKIMKRIKRKIQSKIRTSSADGCNLTLNLHLTLRASSYSSSSS